MRNETPFRQLSRRRFLQASTAGTLSLVGAPAQSGKQWNIVFLFSDDHAYQAISAYGSRINHTPNIDRLAREGMLFRNCLVTNSICAPSRAVILTGKYSHLNGVLDNRLPFDGSQQTFPKLLQKAGYETALFGKWHLKSDPTGFNAWEILPGQGDYYNPEMLSASGRKKHEGYVTDVVTDRSIEWLRSGRDPNKPFLLMCQHKAPHRNWMPGPEHLSMYDGRMIPEPPALFDSYENRASPAGDQAMEIGEDMDLASDLKVPPPPGTPQSDPSMKRWLANYGRLTEEQRRMWDAIYGPKNEAFRKADLQGKELVQWKYQRYIKDYLRCVASVDDNVGRVLRYLDAVGLADNTIVVYSSDQGFYLGEHGWFDKRWMYEESLKTPLLVRWPGVTPPGAENTDMVSNLDFPETFLQAAGAPAPSDMQGRSLVPLLEGKTPNDWRTSFYYHYYESGGHGVPQHYGVRTEKHKLIHFPESKEWELFDLVRDPGEMYNRYGDSEYAGIQKKLHAELEQQRRNLKVPAAPSGP